jgi:hypothetical protein
MAALTEEEAPVQLKVTAYPNPFVDVVRFTISTDVAGQARLDLVNMVGQKVATVYNGYMQPGKSQAVEYRSRSSVQENLIYIFTIGGKQVTGKLLRIHP